MRTDPFVLDELSAFGFDLFTIDSYFFNAGA